MNSMAASGCVLIKILIQISLDIATPGSPYVQRIQVLDDTGSSYVELFYDDCVGFGFDCLNPPFNHLRVDYVIHC